jgi:hypothetical protein
MTDNDRACVGTPAISAAAARVLMSAACHGTSAVYGPATCWSSPRPNGSIGWAPSCKRRACNFLEGKLNLAYEESPRPNTATCVAEREFEGNSLRRRTLQDFFMLSGALPCPVVETKKTTRDKDGSIRMSKSSIAQTGTSNPSR